MIIAVEGHDGTGKTTLAEQLAKAIGFEYAKHPVSKLYNLSEEEYISLSESVIKNGNEITIATFLLVADMYALEQYKFKNVVLDRHSLLNYFWNGSVQTESLFAYAVEHCGKPDLTILLSASPETRIERLRKRDEQDKDLNNETILSASDEKLLYYLNKYNLDFIRIDTDGLSKEEVLKTTLKKIKEYGNKKED